MTSTVIEDASHTLFPEQPAAVAGAVIGYLENLKLIPPMWCRRSQRLLAGGVPETPDMTLVRRVVVVRFRRGRQLALFANSLVH